MRQCGAIVDFFVDSAAFRSLRRSNGADVVARGELSYALELCLRVNGAAGVVRIAQEEALSFGEGGVEGIEIEAELRGKRDLENGETGVAQVRVERRVHGRGDNDGPARADGLDKGVGLAGDD